MNIVITGRHMTVNQALRAHIIDVLESLSGRVASFYRAEVVLEQVRHQTHAEAVVYANAGRFNAKAVSPDMYAAAQGAVSKVEHQMRTRIDRKQQPRPGRDYRASCAVESAP